MEMLPCGRTDGRTDVLRTQIEIPFTQRYQIISLSESLSKSTMFLLLIRNLNTYSCSVQLADNENKGREKYRFCEPVTLHVSHSMRLSEVLNLAAA